MLYDIKIYYVIYNTISSHVISYKQFRGIEGTPRTLTNEARQATAQRQRSAAQPAPLAHEKGLCELL